MFSYGNALKAAFFNFFGKAAHRRDRKVHLCGTVVRFAEKLDLSNTVDDHVAFAEIGKLPGLKADAVREIRCGIAQILYFACELLCVLSINISSSAIPCTASA